MAKFLRTSGISHKIEDIIIDAQKELVIVSPYLKIPNNLFERLKEKSESGVRIDFVYGKSELTYSERQKIECLPTISLYYHENLHAKCYYNEQEMIITSMNLYEFSEKNNREMGVLIHKGEDEQLYNDGVLETKSIITASQKLITGKVYKEHKKVEEKQPVVTSNYFDIIAAKRLLFNELKDQYPNTNFGTPENNNYRFSISHDTEQILVNIEPDTFKWRIDVRLQMGQYKERKRVYDRLSKDWREDIEAAFPAKTVNWGWKMRRIKIDIYKSDYPEFFAINETAVKSTIEFISIIEREIIERIKKDKILFAARDLAREANF